jgi:hypothetical protein
LLPYRTEIFMSEMITTYPIATGLVVFLLCATWRTAGAHGGGLNSEGCHNNRKTGDYHCHRSAARQAVPVNLVGNKAPVPVVAAGARPQCFTGPRGGTYTITASGRKNYSGC